MSTYYIATTGNDTTGNGTAGNPWLTISKAIAASASGDTIIIRNGTYAWVDQTFTTSRTIQAETSQLVIFDATNNNRRWTFSTDGATISFTGIVFKNIIQTSTGDNGIFYQPNSNTINFTQCTFNTMVINGTYSNGGFTDTRGAAAAINFSSCLFNDFKQYNPFTGGFSGIFRCAGGGVLDLSITNCSIYLTGGAGYQFNNGLFVLNQGGTTINLTFKNNIIMNTGYSLPWVQMNGAAFNTTYSYNCINGTFTSAPTASTGTITTDPLFVDAASGNFNLRPTSPCIDTGTLV